MKSIKLSIVAVLLATSGVVSSISANDVEVSANVALTSNYVWRGMTQSDNLPAVQGGIDLGYKGAYLGIWGSNVDFDNMETSSEFDIYAGYANELGAFSYDVNYCQYTYPGDNDELSFGEASLTLGYDFEIASVSAKYYVGVDTHDVSNDSVNGWEPGDGWEVSVSVPLPLEIILDAAYGDYDDAGTQNNSDNNFGNYYSVSLSKRFGKFDVSLAYTGMDYDSSTVGRDSDGSEDYIVGTVSTGF